MKHIFLDADKPQHPLMLPLGVEFEVVRSTVTRTDAPTCFAADDRHTMVHFVRRVHGASVPHRVLLDPDGGVGRVFAAHQGEPTPHEIIDAITDPEGTAS